jgi:hypothetical protein
VGKTVECKVVGLTFVDGYPANLHRLRSIDEDRKRRAIRAVDSADEFGADVEPGLPVVLIRNPHNEHDANAIEVHVPVLGRNGMIGHVPRALAAKLAPSMDRGDVWESRLKSVLVDPEHEDRPGVLIAIECVSKAVGA